MNAMKMVTNIFARTKRVSPAFRECDIYPELNNMLVTYFDQDYDIISEHPDEILAAFKREAPQEHVRDVVADTRRFIADFGESDEKLSTTFKSLFNPDAGFEGWEGRTTREWLLRMIDIFSE